MEIERHLLVMLGLYEAMLGDTFVREAIPSTIRAARIAGINGKKSGYITTWSMGVQKVVLRSDWDYSSSIS